MPDERRTRLEERERIPEHRLELELPPQMPEADLPTAVGRDNPLAREPEGGNAPGQLATGVEARAALGGMRVAPEVALAGARASNQVAAAMAGARDEIDDATAANFAARAFGADRRPVYGVDHPVPPAPENLPAVLRTTIFDPNRRTDVPPRDPQWLQIYQLPRYLQEGIRTLGRSIFDTFPCFATQRRVAAEQGQDALGSVHALVNLQGGGPSLPSDLDRVATWIRAHGTPVDAAQLEIPEVLPGYRPRVVLAATEDRSYLMVDERRTEGAPGDNQYIYSWAGGRIHYLQHPRDAQRVAGLLQAGGGPRRLAAPVGQNRERAPAGLRRRLEAHAPRAALPQPALQPMDRGEVRDPGERKSKIAALEERTAIVGGLIADLRRFGFIPNGPQSTPCFRKRLENGGHAEITGAEGVLAQDHDSFELRVFDPAGQETWSGRIASRHDVEEAIDATPPPAPR